MDGSHHHNGLGKLLPKSLTRRKHRGRKGHKTGRSNGEDGDDNETAGDDASSDRPVSSSGGGDSSLYGDGDDDATAVSGETTEETEDGSFVSYGSSRDASGGSLLELQHSSSRSLSARPIPSNHPSQVGYLTTSSPAVQAIHLDTPPKIRPSSRNSRSPWRRGGKADKADSSEAAESAKFPELPVSAKLAVSDRDRDARNKPSPKLDVDVPRTPPNGDKSGLVIVNTPPTPVEPGVSDSTPSPDHKPSFAYKTSAEAGSPTRVMAAHKKSRSGGATIGPSKLSNITSAPLTPGTEMEDGNMTPNATGFFSSVLSVAQSAATTLSNNIPGTSGIGIAGIKNKAGGSRSGSLEAIDQLSQDDVSTSSHQNKEESAQKQSNPQSRGTAVQTLGAGELSLSQLGLSEVSNIAASPASGRFPDVVDKRARSESAPVESHGELPGDETASGPRSAAESTNGDEFVNSQLDLSEAKFSINRSSSMRSALKSQRKRGSSVTTGTTVGVPAGAAAQAAPALAAPKLTGFAVASKKRNRDFHSLFETVPDDDYLIEDYSCALQEKILNHGRLYVSEGHLCFYSNIFGYITMAAISFDEIVSVEKKNTALIFKNGLLISTLHRKYTFASFTSRDATYDLIVNIWMLGHTTLKSSLNGVQLEGMGGDKTEKVEEEPQGADMENESLEDSDSEGSSDEDDFYDEEQSDSMDARPMDANGGPDTTSEKAASRKVSAMTTLNDGAPADGSKEAASSSSPSADFPGPATHAPSECMDLGTHYDKIVGDDVIPAPLGKVYNLLFGAGSANWMTKWLQEDQKCQDVQVDDKKGLTMDNTTRTWTYIKPLYAALGPKQTKCIVTENLESLDYEKSISLVLSTRTPEVPSGTLFTVKTKYCFTWAENNSTRMQVNHITEWSGKSWLKGTIDKSVNDGQTQYCKELFTFVKAAVTTRGRSSTLSHGAKGKKKGKRGRASLAAKEASDAAEKTAKASKANWGALEPARGILEPLLDILKPILTGNIMYGLLVGLLVASWFGFGLSPSKRTGGFGGGGGELIDMYGPHRLAAYEEMWRREESELWNWLQERTGLGQLDSDRHGVRRRAIEPRTLQERMRETQMDKREVEEAVRITEEKLKMLRQVLVSNEKQERKQGAVK